MARTASRAGKYAVEILQGFDGVLQVDGYTGYNRVKDRRDNAPVELAYCWAHARRKLFELTINNVAPLQRRASNRSKHSTALKRRSGECQLTSVLPYAKRGDVDCLKGGDGLHRRMWSKGWDFLSNISAGKNFKYFFNIYNHQHLDTVIWQKDFWTMGNNAMNIFFKLTLIIFLTTNFSMAFVQETKAGAVCPCFTTADIVKTCDNPTRGHLYINSKNWGPSQGTRNENSATQVIISCVGGGARQEYEFKTQTEIGGGDFCRTDYLHDPNAKWKTLNPSSAHMCFEALWHARKQLNFPMTDNN